MNTKPMPEPQPPAPLPAARGSAAGALAQGVWNVAKEREMLFEDIIGCCAILVSSVSVNSGEPMDYLLSEVAIRAALIDIPPDAVLQECELCHTEYSIRDVEMSDSGQILCKKCSVAEPANAPNELPRAHDGTQNL